MGDCWCCNHKQRSGSPLTTQSKYSLWELHTFSNTTNWKKMYWFRKSIDGKHFLLSYSLCVFLCLLTYSSSVTLSVFSILPPLCLTSFFPFAFNLSYLFHLLFPCLSVFSIFSIPSVFFLVHTNLTSPLLFFFRAFVLVPLFRTCIE